MSSHDVVTVRDTFALSAPAPPEWYREPPFEEPEPQPPSKPPESTQGHLDFNHWLAATPKGSLPDVAQLDEALRPFGRAWVDHASAHDAWRVRRQLHRQNAWRYAYADALLAARERGGQS